MKNSYLLIALLAAVLLCLPQWASAQTYVGPEKCLQCHNNAGLGDKTGWRTTMHANGYSEQLDDEFTMQSHLGVVNDYDQNGIDDFHDGLDFNTISSVFDPYKPNAPVLAYSEADGYTITIGNATHRMYLTYGGSGLYKQRYAVKINTSEGESKDHYISPIQFNEKTHGYVLYHPDAWYDGNNMPIDYSTLALAATNNRSMTKGCSGCHLTGLEVETDANGEWIQHAAGVENEALYADKNNVYDIDGDGDLDVMNTSCETCHGPGGDHASTGDKTKIINPRNLTSEQATNLCGMCHSRGKSMPNHTFGYAYNDDNLTNWAPGDLVADFYSDGSGDWPDGSSVKHHQQFNDFVTTDKWNFQFHPVTCFECHDVHNTVKHQIREEIIEEDSTGAEITVATDNDDNTLCLACHATHGAFSDIPVEWVADYDNHVNDIAPIVTAHTKHMYDPTGTGASRCSKCHNPKISKSAIAYDIHAHTFRTLSPELTKFYQPEGGMPNSCAVSCHMKNGFPNFGIDFSGDALTNWTETTDLALADTLLHYFGPGGVWWDTGFPMAVEELPGAALPQSYVLSQNFPNPFNPTTKITFDVANAGFVTLKVYNILGQEVATLANKTLLSGRYSVDFDGSSLASGVYVYKLNINGFVESKKMVLAK